ncbi:probable cytochrome P450 6a13 [Copidosoma floridanum]|uniref:probable cytochrome P450 6a13 n=1 Tax=Copidosoma floridanum TaxID=29053 RepID=UPI0006C99DB8|nr:probable cytochrome P450 6a13 [Copidosoma floridanum]
MEYCWGATEVLAGLGVAFVVVYYYFTWTFDFWSSRGVAGPKPEPFLGNFRELMFNRTYMGDYFKRLYNEYGDEPMVGVYARRTPVLMLRDPELIKNVLIKDFGVFADRGITTYAKIEPLGQHLFSLEPERWRPLRVNLSPVFTSGKLKEMFYLLTECAEHFEDFLGTMVAKSPELECRDLTAKFTTDVIGVCAFGLKMNALAEEESQFRKIGRKVFEVSLLKSIRLKIREATPWLYKLLGPFMYDRETNDFFIGSITETMEYRRRNNIKRNDFVDLLMEIRDNPEKISQIEMTDTLLTAQAFVFFIAGYETSSTTISNALYELALNQDVQEKLRQEVRDQIKEHNGSLTFDGIKSMKYMHKVFYETLRKYPPVAVLMRKSVKEYTFPGTSVTIPKDTRVWIPAYAIQRDPQIYPNPEVFDPERFDEEIHKQRHPAHFLPFGDGPRNCIGARFANYQSKVGIAVILKNYKVDVCDKTCIPYVNNPRAFLIAPVGGIVLKFTKV